MLIDINEAERDLIIAIMDIRAVANSQWKGLREKLLAKQVSQNHQDRIDQLACSILPIMIQEGGSVDGIVTRTHDFINAYLKHQVR
jgi:hypothetical protein